MLEARGERDEEEEKSLMAAEPGSASPVVSGRHLLTQLLDVVATFFNLHHLHPLHWTHTHTHTNDLGSVRKQVR